MCDFNKRERNPFIRVIRVITLHKWHGTLTTRAHQTKLRQKSRRSQPLSKDCKLTRPVCPGQTRTQTSDGVMCLPLISIRTDDNYDASKWVRQPNWVAVSLTIALLGSHQDSRTYAFSARNQQIVAPIVLRCLRNKRQARVYFFIVPRTFIT